MAQYRKKPVVIDAVQLVAEGAHAVAAWCGGRPCSAAKPSDPDDVAVWLEIPTLEGVMRADVNDWIIRGVKGEFYPCKPDIFEATYEAVDA
jgi:hypothetical protein